MDGVTFNRKQNNEQGKFDRYDTIKKAIEEEEKDKEEEKNYENLGRSIRKVIKLSKVSEKAITGEITHRRNNKEKVRTIFLSDKKGVMVFYVTQRS